MTEDGARWAAMHPRPMLGHTPERDGVDSTRLRAEAVDLFVHGTARHSAPPNSAFLIFSNRGSSRSPKKGDGEALSERAGHPLLEQDKDRAMTRNSGLGGGWMDGYVVSALATHHPPVCCLEEPNCRACTSPSRSAGWVHLLEHRVRRREAHRDRPTIIWLGSVRR
jgi:hypothetical protein